MQRDKISRIDFPCVSSSNLLAHQRFVLFRVAAAPARININHFFRIKDWRGRGTVCRLLRSRLPDPREPTIRELAPRNASASLLP